MNLVALFLFLGTQSAPYCYEAKENFVMMSTKSTLGYPSCLQSTASHPTMQLLALKLSVLNSPSDPRLARGVFGLYTFSVQRKLDV